MEMCFGAYILMPHQLNSLQQSPSLHNLQSQQLWKMKQKRLSIFPVLFSNSVYIAMGSFGTYFDSLTLNNHILLLLFYYCIFI